MSRTPRPWLPVLVLAACALGSCAGSELYYREAPGSVPPLAEAEIDHRLILVGDAGNVDPELRLLGLLARQAGALPGRTTVVFLGDNIYPAGLPDRDHADRAEAQRRLDAQLDAVQVAGARGRFVPGNHDWDNSGPEGLARVTEQGAYVEGRGRADRFDARVTPAGGCPGPAGEGLGERGQLIALDTQWWLHAHAKPAPDVCAHGLPEEVLASLTAQIEAAGRAGRRVFVVAHHPLLTKGPHAGHFAWPTHGLPLFGSLYVLVRRYFSPSPQDLSHGANRRMRKQLERAMGAAAGGTLLYAAGHDHSLQVFEGGAQHGAEFLVVSGLGSRHGATAVGTDDATLFAYSSGERPGFVRIDLARDGRVRLAALAWDAASPLGRELYARLLR